MTTIGMGDARIEARGLPRGGRVAYALCTWLLAAGITVQVFLAGLAIMVDGSNLEAHRGVGSLLIMISPLALVAGFVGRLPRRMLVLTGLLVVLMFLQMVFVAVPIDSDVSGVRALHTVNALAVFVLSVHLGQGAVRLLRSPRDRARPA